MKINVTLETICPAPLEYKRATILDTICLTGSAKSKSGKDITVFEAYAERVSLSELVNGYHGSYDDCVRFFTSEMDWLSLGETVLGFSPYGIDRPHPKGIRIPSSRTAQGIIIQAMNKRFGLGLTANEAHSVNFDILLLQNIIINKKNPGIEPISMKGVIDILLSSCAIRRGGNPTILVMQAFPLQYIGKGYRRSVKKYIVRPDEGLERDTGRLVRYYQRLGFKLADHSLLRRKKSDFICAPWLGRIINPGVAA